jgi:hypothetical protein
VHSAPFAQAKMKSEPIEHAFDGAPDVTLVIWLAFLDTYLTMCVAPESSGRRGLPPDATMPCVALNGSARIPPTGANRFAS